MRRQMVKELTPPPTPKSLELDMCVSSLNAPSVWKPTTGMPVTRPSPLPLTITREQGNKAYVWGHAGLVCTHNFDALRFGGKSGKPQNEFMNQWICWVAISKATNYFLCIVMHIKIDYLSVVLAGSYVQILVYQNCTELWRRQQLQFSLEILKIWACLNRRYNFS